MTGPQLATLATIGWVIVTLAFLVAFGTWSVGGSWSILPGLVRGVHDWAAEHAVAQRPSSPSPWALTMPDPTSEPHAGTEPLESLDASEIEELWSRSLDD